MKIKAHRNPQTLVELRGCTSVEEIPVKIRVRAIPTSWDDVSRETSKSWKSVSKAQHQYMKGF